MQVNCFLLLAIVAVSTSGFSATMEDLVLSDGLYYRISEQRPFSGKISGQSYGFFKDGLRHGTWIYFHDNGGVKNKGGFKNGRKHGPWMGFYANGKLFYKGDYFNGKKQGPWVSYYENERLFYQGNFENGREDGPWQGFNPDGSLWPYRTGIFQKGTKIRD